jgi:K+/H+ antiporter YhaU regulatory subunit KhtT
MLTTTTIRLGRFGIALCAMSAVAMAADAAVEKGKSAAAAPVDIQKLVQQLGAQRDSMISEHEALAKQLKDATDVQKKAILEKMADQKKAFEEATSALHKQIRDEQRRQRQSVVPGKR